MLVPHEAYVSAKPAAANSACSFLSKASQGPRSSWLKIRCSSAECSFMTVRSAISRKPPIDNLIKTFYYVVKEFYHMLVQGKGASRGKGEGWGPLAQTLL